MESKALPRSGHVKKRSGGHVLHELEGQFALVGRYDDLAKAGSGGGLGKGPGNDFPEPGIQMLEWFVQPHKRCTSGCARDEKPGKQLGPHFLTTTEGFEPKDAATHVSSYLSVRAETQAAGPKDSLPAHRDLPDERLYELLGDRAACGRERLSRGERHALLAIERHLLLDSAFVLVHGRQRALQQLLRGGVRCDQLVEFLKLVPGLFGLLQQGLHIDVATGVRFRRNRQRSNLYEKVPDLVQGAPAFVRSLLCLRRRGGQ